MRPRQVLVLLNSTELGGTQINAIDLARAVREHGYESHLLAWRLAEDQDAAVAAVAAEHGLDLEIIDRPAHTWSAGSRLEAFADGRRIDLVHTYGSWNAGPAFWGPHRLGRRGLVMTAYEMALPADLLRTPTLIVGTRYLLEEQLGQRPGPTYLVSPPVDVDRDRSDAVDSSGFLQAHGLAPGHTRVVLVSRLAEEMKAIAVEAAIDAVDRLARPDLDLVIVGSGDAEARLRARGDAVNVRLGRTAVVFTGALGDPRPAYACADIMLGMGGSAARSLSFGKPLVVTGERGWSDVFTPDSADRLFRDSFWSPLRPLDPVTPLAAQLLALAREPAMRRELGSFGRSFATEHFGLPAMAATLAGIYRHELARPGRTSTWVREAGRDAARRGQRRRPGAGVAA